MTGDVSVFGWATVVSANPLTVRRDGETAPLGVSPFSLVDTSRLAVGDRVWIQLVDRRALIIGKGQGMPSEPRVHAAVLGDASGSVPNAQVTTVTGYAVNRVSGTYLSTTSSTIKTHKKGWYEIIGAIRWDSTSTDGTRQLRLVHDYTYTPRVYSEETVPTNTRFGQHVSTFALLPANDTISMQVYQNRGYSLGYTSFTSGSTSLRVRWLGEDT